MSYRLICLCSLLVVVTQPDLARAQNADAATSFRAAASTSNITPPLGEPIVGGFTPFPSKHVHDELHARTLVLDDGKIQLAIVLCDNVGVPQEVFDSAREQIQAATGLPPAHVLMAATHTHSATSARGPGSRVIKQTELTNYQKFLANRISDGVRRAINQLEPARIGWSSVEEPSEIFNRRWHVTDSTLLTNPLGGVDKVRMNPPRGSAALVRPAGPVDPEVSFVSVQSAAGRPIALLANYSLHYVGGVQGADISADYFGYFAKFIERRMEATDQDIPFVGIMSNGTSGDINNIDFQGKGQSYKSYEKMKEVAQKLADRVYEAHQSVTFHNWVSLGVQQKNIELAVRKPTQEMLDHFARIQADQSGKDYLREKIYAERIGYLKDAPESIEVPLQVLRIGELGIAAIPFETFAEIGLELKDRSPLPQMFTIELANGSMGYLPTPEQHELGGYETWLGTNFVEVNASRKITEALLTMLAEVKKGMSPAQ